MSQKIATTLTVNGRRHTVTALPDTPLLPERVKLALQEGETRNV